MKVSVFPEAQSAGRAAARAAAALLHNRPAAVLGLATGHTMIPIYGELVRAHEEEGLSFKRAQVFNLDEYAGVGPGHPDSFHEFMRMRLVSQVDLPAESFHILNGRAPDLALECARYEEQITAAGGIDLQLLGLGRNGHVAFNEPGAPADSRTRVVRLSEETRNINAGDFRLLAETPAEALTMGVATILSAHRVLLVVTGWEKAEILFRVLIAQPSPELPASFLHTHPRVNLVADRQALELYFERHGRKGENFEVAE